VLDEDSVIDVSDQDKSKTQLSSSMECMEEVMRGVVDVLEIEPDTEPDTPSKFVSLLWVCSDSVKAQIKKAVKDHHRLDHPELGQIWVHPADYSDFSSSTALAVSKETASAVRNQVQGVLADSKSNFENLSAAIGSVEKNVTDVKAGQELLLEGQARLEKGQERILELTTEISITCAETSKKIDRSSSALLTAIVEAGDIAAPTTFVILPCKIGEGGSDPGLMESFFAMDEVAQLSATASAVKAFREDPAASKEKWLATMSDPTEALAFAEDMKGKMESFEGGVETASAFLADPFGYGKKMAMEKAEQVRNTIQRKKTGRLLLTQPRRYSRRTRARARGSTSWTSGRASP
jgi:hypothetical protein